MHCPLSGTIAEKRHALMWRTWTGDNNVKTRKDEGWRRNLVSTFSAKSDIDRPLTTYSVEPLPINSNRTGQVITSDLGASSIVAFNEML